MDELDIQLSDLSDYQREIAETIGLDNYVELSKRFGGEDSIYIQKYSELIKIVRNKEIRKRYNGYNSKLLAKMYNLSERYIREICCDKDIIEGQITW